MPYSYERQVYTASHVHVARFVWDKSIELFKLESNNTKDTYG